MHDEVNNFCIKIRDKYPSYFKDKKVLDVGSLDINGNNRYLFEDCIYSGLDLAEGSNVDIVSITHEYNAPDCSYDFVISTECFEHDLYWEKSVKNIIRILKSGGAFLFTCATTGRHEHGTERSDKWYSAPFLQGMENDWKNYYRNLTENDFMSIDGFEEAFQFYSFEINHGDLYFFGVKK